MDDLAGLNWTPSSQSNVQQQPSGPSNANYFPTLRPTPPASGRSTPANAPPPSGLKSPANLPTGSKTASPANDSFANLLPFNPTQTTKSVSLQEQQKALQAQKARQLGLSGLSSSSQPTSNGNSGRSTPNHVLPHSLSGLGSQASGSRL